MEHDIRISDDLYKRLEKRAVGFDTPANVIEKILDEIERLNNTKSVDKSQKVKKIPQAKKAFKVRKPTRVRGKRILPITLDPANRKKFKEKLLETKTAVLCIEYGDGRIEEENWNADRITENSNITANLRSRDKLRQGKWQQLGIKRVSVRVV